MEEELIEVLDENGLQTGVIKKKSDIKKDGDFHQAISVIVLNKNKEVLIHKRSSKKKIYPDLWSIFIRGHVTAHETTIDSCIRELNEEIALKIKKEDLIYLYSRKEEDKNKEYINNLFYENYLLITDIDEINYNEEISEVKFIKINELKEKIIVDRKSFVPNDEDYNIIFNKLNVFKED